MLLNSKMIDAAKAPAKACKLPDGKGLFLLVNPNGSKLWRLRYKVDGREKLLAIGAYPAVGLADARRAAEDARRLVKAGGDPSQAKQRARKETIIENANTFRRFGQMALDRVLADGAEGTKTHWRRDMKRCIAHFGERPVSTITRGDVLAFLHKWDSIGQASVAHSLKQKISGAFELAIDFEACQHNPAQFKAGRIKPMEHTNHPAILDPVRFGDLLRAIEGAPVCPATAALLRLSALCFLRPNEMVKAQWSEIDFDACQWTVPAERMKKVGGVAREHVVPLSRQAVAILQELQRLQGDGLWIFPSWKKSGATLHKGRAGEVMRSLGFGGEMTAHGFRASATTLCVERLQWPRWINEPSKVADRQLAHKERKKTQRAYNRAEFIEGRTWMMQAWADYCDVLRDGGEVIPMTLDKSWKAR